MKSRSAAVSLLGVVGLLVSGVAFQQSEAFVADPAGQQPAERQTRAERRAERETRQLTDPGQHLAFDVRPRDHRTTPAMFSRLPTRQGRWLRRT
ncbi:MAG: hypothetical protein H0X67_10760 [Acidobacteria bacterium]|nr:hypothetical protein [Acidobacteriota bacterium]